MARIYSAGKYADWVLVQYSAIKQSATKLRTYLLFNNVYNKITTVFKRLRHSQPINTKSI